MCYQTCHQFTFVFLNEPFVKLVINIFHTYWMNIHVIGILCTDFEITLVFVSINDKIIVIIFPLLPKTPWMIRVEWNTEKGSRKISPNKYKRTFLVVLLLIIDMFASIYIDKNMWHFVVLLQIANDTTFLSINSCYKLIKQRF